MECSFYPWAPVFTFFPALAASEMASDPKLQHKWSQRNSGHPMYDFNRGEWKEGGWVAERLRPVSDNAKPETMRATAASCQQTLEYEGSCGFLRTSPFQTMCE